VGNAGECVEMRGKYAWKCVGNAWGMRGKLFQVRFFFQQPGESFICGPGGFGVVALPPFEFSSGFIARGFPDISPGDPFPSQLKNLINVSLHRLASFSGSSKGAPGSLCFLQICWSIPAIGLQVFLLLVVRCLRNIRIPIHLFDARFAINSSSMPDFTEGCDNMNREISTPLPYRPIFA
jgi:hypothetical protein